jgi:hypothetical protein
LVEEEEVVEEEVVEVVVVAEEVEEAEAEDRRAGEEWLLMPRCFLGGGPGTAAVPAIEEATGACPNLKKSIANGLDRSFNNLVKPLMPLYLKFSSDCPSMARIRSPGEGPEAPRSICDPRSGLVFNNTKPICVSNKDKPSGPSPQVMEYWYPLFSVGMQVFNRAAMGGKMESLESGVPGWVAGSSLELSIIPSCSPMIIRLSSHVAQHRHL